ncbi:MAG: TolC family protein [Deltaproteobacteria bacterium]|nr:TolC family protein [Deltaproteobacteria bacterium]
MKRVLPAAAFAVALACARTVGAHAVIDTSKTPASCPKLLTTKTVVECALSTSPDVASARAQLAAGSGRRLSANTWLPSNPVVSASLSQRQRPAPENVQALNWSLSLAQQFEIAGQRGLRLRAADAEVSAQIRRVGVAEQDVASNVLSVFFNAVAARESLGLAEELFGIAEALSRLVEGRAAESVMSGVEADVARAEAIRLALIRFEAERNLSQALTDLRVSLSDTAGSLIVPQVLTPPAVGDMDEAKALNDALRLRGELAAADMERVVLESRLALVRRERMPNPTVSVFAERGEINDRILGLGLSFPLPLPAPIGRSRAGDISELQGQIRASESSVELVRRRVQREVANALALQRAKTAALALFDPALIARARADLAAIKAGISMNQLPLNEALVWQRGLIELLQSEIQVRREQALAWVELHRVTGTLVTAVLGEGQ